ncbi:MAG TPA: hypothetical protein PKW80_09365 [Bacteroidales bacterium]|nr:hypothetical protein [Bacteroidales bacterium]
MSNYHRLFLIFIYLLASLFIKFNEVTAQHTDTAKFSPAIQQKWLEQTASRMIDFIPDTLSGLLKPVTNVFEDYFMFSFRLKDSGWIKLENARWICLISSSAHSNPEVGDITIAMDDKKHFYTNKSHVCGGVVHFQCRKRIILKSPEDFFNNFEGDTDNMPWEYVTIKLKKSNKSKTH